MSRATIQAQLLQYPAAAPCFSWLQQTYSCKDRHHKQKQDERRAARGHLVPPNWTTEISDLCMCGRLGVESVSIDLKNLDTTP